MEEQDLPVRFSEVPDMFGRFKDVCLVGFIMKRFMVTRLFACCSAASCTAKAS